MRHAALLVCSALALGAEAIWFSRPSAHEPINNGTLTNATLPELPPPVNQTTPVCPQEGFGYHAASEEEDQPALCCPPSPIADSEECDCEDEPTEHEGSFGRRCTVRSSSPLEEILKLPTGGPPMIDLGAAASGLEKRLWRHQAAKRSNTEVEEKHEQVYSVFIPCVPFEHPPVTSTAEDCSTSTSTYLKHDKTRHHSKFSTRTKSPTQHPPTPKPETCHPSTVTIFKKKYEGSTQTVTEWAHEPAVTIRETQVISEPGKVVTIHEQGATLTVQKVKTATRTLTVHKPGQTTTISEAGATLTVERTKISRIHEPPATLTVHKITTKTSLVHEPPVTITLPASTTTRSAVSTSFATATSVVTRNGTVTEVRQATTTLLQPTTITLRENSTSYATQTVEKGKNITETLVSTLVSHQPASISTIISIKHEPGSTFTQYSTAYVTQTVEKPGSKEIKTETIFERTSIHLPASTITTTIHKPTTVHEVSTAFATSTVVKHQVETISSTCTETIHHTETSTCYETVHHTATVTSHLPAETCKEGHHGWGGKDDDGKEKGH